MIVRLDLHIERELSGITLNVEHATLEFDLNIKMGSNISLVR